MQFYINYLNNINTQTSTFLPLPINFNNWDRADHQKNFSPDQFDYPLTLKMIAAMAIMPHPQTMLIRYPSHTPGDVKSQPEIEIHISQIIIKLQPIVSLCEFGYKQEIWEAWINCCSWLVIFFCVQG